MERGSMEVCPTHFIRYLCADRLDLEYGKDEWPTDFLEIQCIVVPFTEIGHPEEKHIFWRMRSGIKTSILECYVETTC